MAGFRFPGAIGNGMSTYIDVGTLTRAVSMPPGLIDPLDHAKHWVRQQIRQRSTTVIQGAGELAYRVVMQELRALHGDIQAKVDYIATLPGELRDRVAADFFSSFFDHYLPKKFIHHFVYGNGKQIKLNLKEMIDCNPSINLLESTPFNNRLSKLRSEAASRQSRVDYPFTLEMRAIALTNGTLGQFTTKLNGLIQVQADGSWVAEGRMEFADDWDFDPKDLDRGGRSASGEAKTRVAHAFLPGKAFSISSESADFRQTERDARVVWAGGMPVPAYDKVSAADIGVTRPER